MVIYLRTHEAGKGTVACVSGGSGGTLDRMASDGLREKVISE